MAVIREEPKSSSAFFGQKSIGPNEFPNVQLHLAEGYDINARLEGGQTLLHWAMAYSAPNDALIRFLLNNGADETLKDSHHRTPLELAQQLKTAHDRGISSTNVG